ncbi:MAG TPA: HlyD family efflux transporter periplasmic adaptor subunit [Pirellulaceae bacterium]|nr:HlyD family efflux transporter periplasmic adaptor subunit [Pirellulaceae bacterium]
MKFSSSSQHALGIPRRGNAMLIVVVFLVVVAGVGSAVWWVYFRGKSDAASGPILNAAIKGPYDFIVLEQGEVEAANAIELRCEVKSRGAGGSGGGIAILEVVPEGTLAKKGDVLIRLDSSALEQELKQQEITVNTSHSLVVQAKNTLEAAKIARKEYLEGTFRNEERTITSEVFVAEQALSTAQLSYESSQRLAAKGLLTPLQLSGAQYAVQKAQNDLDNANGKLQVLRELTKNKMLTQFDSDIATAEAKVKAEESSHQIELDKKKEVEDQIAKCTIRAPADGQVVYVNKFDRGRSGSSAEFVVEAGATVREQQPLIRLPSSNDMQIKALVNEARVTLVRPGQPVTVRVDALKDELIKGEVVKVNQYAEPGGWSSGNIKKYATLIKINNPPDSLRSGMNAEVRIHIERRQDALQVPVQALAEYRGKFFMVVRNGEQFETREVKIGSTNDKTAVVESGLELDDRFVMNPRGTSFLDLPELPEPTTVKGDVQLAKGVGSPGLTPAVLDKDGGPPGEGKGGPGGRKGGKGRGFTPQAVLDQFDTDKDGKLSQAEIESMQERQKSAYLAGDKNSDGFVDMAEIVQIQAEMRRQFEEKSKAGGFGGPPGGAPGGPPGGGQ